MSLQGRFGFGPDADLYNQDAMSEYALPESSDMMKLRGAAIARMRQDYAPSSAGTQVYGQAAAQGTKGLGAAAAVRGGGAPAVTMQGGAGDTAALEAQARTMAAHNMLQESAQANRVGTEANDQTIRKAVLREGLRRAARQRAYSEDQALQDFLANGAKAGAEIAGGMPPVSLAAGRKLGGPSTGYDVEDEGGWMNPYGSAR